MKWVVIFFVTCIMSLINTEAAELRPGGSEGTIPLDSVMSKFGSELIFHASCDDTADADLAGGGNLGKVVKPVLYGPGKCGRALIGGSIEFIAEGNCDSMSGTAVFWVEMSREQTPPATNENAFFPFEIIVGGAAGRSGMTWRIGKMEYRNHGYIYAYMQEGGGGTGKLLKAVHTYRSSLAWKRDEWHLLSMSWAPGSLQISLDGQPFKKNDTIPPLAGKAGKIVIAAVQPPAHPAAVAIDEIMIFSRPLSDEEIAWIWNTMDKYQPLKK